MRSSRYMVFERKSMPMVAWYMLSKESYMKRVIREVLPTSGAEISPVSCQLQPLDTEEYRRGGKRTTLLA